MLLGQVKIIMATNRPDTLDPALLRPRPPRQRKSVTVTLLQHSRSQYSQTSSLIEFSSLFLQKSLCPMKLARLEILKIHSVKINKHGRNW